MEEEGNKQGFEGLPRRLERYAKAHQRAQGMATWLRSQLAPTMIDSRQRRGTEHTAQELDSCGSYLLFRWYGGVDLVRLHAAHFCQQDKLCQFCALRRGAKLLRRYTERVAAVWAREPGKLGAWMVTTTIRNGGDLAERFNHHRRALAALTQRRRDRLNKGQAWTEAARAVGGVGSYEIKRGSVSRTWHPHHHAVWLCESPPDQEHLRREWRDITGDSHIVDVRPFHFVRDGLPGTPENIAADFVEVFKYALKFGDMPYADNWHAAQVLKGRRLVDSFGELRGVEVPEDLLDDPLEDEDEPYVEWLYQFDAAAAAYRRRALSR